MEGKKKKKSDSPKRKQGEFGLGREEKFKSTEMGEGTENREPYRQQSEGKNHENPGGLFFWGGFCFFLLLVLGGWGGLFGGGSGLGGGFWRCGGGFCVVLGGGLFLVLCEDSRWCGQRKPPPYPETLQPYRTPCVRREEA